MRILISTAAAAALLVGGTLAIAQPSSPVPGAQPGAKAPGEELPKKAPEGSGSAPIGPPATGKTEAGPMPGKSSVPGAPNPTEKKLDTPSAGGK
jgi:hypothetical protein